MCLIHQGSQEDCKLKVDLTWRGISAAAPWAGARDKPWVGRQVARQQGTKMGKQTGRKVDRQVGRQAERQVCGETGG